jgi:hypothetical protein
MIPGTSCLATIVLSLRDKNRPPHRSDSHYPSAFGLKPWAEVSSPVGPLGQGKAGRLTYCLAPFVRPDRGPKWPYYLPKN